MVIITKRNGCVRNSWNVGCSGFFPSTPANKRRLALFSTLLRFHLTTSAFFKTPSSSQGQLDPQQRLNNCQPDQLGHGSLPLLDFSRFSFFFFFFFIRQPRRPEIASEKMNPNTRSVLSSWFSSEERPATATPGHHQEAPDYVYAPMHPTLAKKMEKRGAGRGRGAPYGSKPAPRSAGPSPIRPSASSTSGRPPRALDDGEIAVARGPRRQLRSSHDGGLQDDHQRGHQNPDAIKGENPSIFPFCFSSLA